MKLHLPLSLLHAVLCAFCSFTFGTAALVGGGVSLIASYAQAVSFEESNHHIEVSSSLKGGIISSTTTSPLVLQDFSSVQMNNNELVSSAEILGGIVYHSGKYSSELTLSVKGNGDITFCDNSSISQKSVYGGVIYCSEYAELDFSDNADIQFANSSIEGASTDIQGGVLYCSGRNNVYFTNNGSVCFLNNHVIGHTEAENTEGGALCLLRHNANAEKLLMTGNKEVTFSGNSASGQANKVYGGAISSGKILEMSGNNGDMTFRNNSATNTGELIDANAYGGAVYVTAAMKLEHNKGNICVERNNATANSFAAGGAFYLIGSSPFECSENVSVTFSDNSVRAGKTAKGGAICSDININFSGNTGAITFNSNEVISTTQDAEGGAICMASRNAVATFLLSSDLSFASNKATAETQSAKGGAICAARDYGKVLISGDGDVSFKNNVATGLKSYGGAVYMELNAEFDIAVNGEALFAENAVNAVSFALGGAIHTQSDLSLIADTIGFKDNSVSSMSGPAKGGALYAQGRKIGMQSVHDIVFSGNTVSAGAGNEALGGALWASSQQTTILSAGDNIAFLDNHVIGGKTAQGGALHLNAESAISAGNKMTFAGNTAESCETGTAWGGAICLPNPTEIYRLGLSNTLEFKNNAALAEAGDAYGGAVAVDSSSSSGSLEIKGNIAVSFIGNHADSAGGSAYGGAIYAKKRVEIVDNGNVSFRKNYEKQGTAYKLSDIYSVVAPMLSAAEGGEIRFNGAVVVSDSVVLNQDYTGADAQTHQATGSIVFSGKYTEADLKEIKGGIEGTAEEILNSRASSINGILTLNNGRLLVEDQSVLTATRFAAKAGTTVELDNASLVSTSTSTSSSTNTLTDCSLVLTNGGSLTLGGRLTLSGKVTLDVSGYAVGTHTLIAANGVVGADLLDISYTEGKREVYDIAWDDKKTALTLTVTKLGRTEPLTHLWTSDFKVLSDGQTLGDEEFMQGDTLQFNEAAAVTVSGTVKPAAIEVDTAGNVTFTDDSETPGNIAGACTLTKSGSGTLTLNGGNSYTGDTMLNAGTLSASAADSFGQSTVKMQGGTLNLGGYGVSNTIIASGGTLSGAMSYTGTLTVQGTLTIGANTTAGSVVLNSGSLAGGSLKNTTITAKGGSIGSDILSDSCLSVNGDVSVSGALSAAVQLQSGTLSLSDALAMQRGQSLSWQGGELTGDVLSSAGAMLSVTQDGALHGNLTLNGGELKTDGHTLDISGALSLLNSTQLNVSAMGVGRHDILTFGSMVGSLDMLELIGSPYIATLEQGDNSISVLVKAPVHTLQWNSPKGIWSAEDGTTWDLITEDGIEPGYDFHPLDIVEFRSAAKLTIRGTVEPGSILVDSDKNVTFSSDKKVAGSGIIGDATLTKDGAGLLTMNAGNTYTGGTTLNAGTLKATAADSFGVGTIAVKGGTLDLGSKAVANDIVLSGEATLKGDAKYMGNVTVEGDATLLAKTSYKGMTSIGAGSTLTLTPKATMAGSMTLDGGTLNISAPKGMTLAKNMTMLLNGGTVSGLLTIGTGSTLVWQGGSFDAAAPVLKGGTLQLGAETSLTLAGSKAQVAFGDKRVELPGKGVVYTDETLTVNGGTVTVSALSGYEGSIEVAGGTLKLATGKVYTDNEIVVSGNAAVVNGKMHFGDITVNGTLAKGTNITIADGKTVQLNGAGVMLGTIAGAGTVDVNASIDATAAKITAAHINLNNGTFTNTKGIKLAKGQTLTLAGARLDLGLKGALATVAGSTLVVDRNTTLTGSLTLGGGELVFNNTTLELDGTATLTLSKAMTVTGSGTIHYTTLKAAKNVDVVKLFGEGAELDKEHCILTFNGGAAESGMASAPLATAAEAPAPLDATPAIPVVNPVADAMVQADWGIIDAERAFMGAVNSRSQHAALLDKGRGAAWVSAFGASVRHGNQGSHHGSDANIEGAAFGLEHAVSDTGTLGLAVGRSKNRIAATGVTHLRQETAHVALYGQKHLAHGFTADAAASYGDTETKLGAASWQQKSAALTARLTHAQQLTDATAFRTFGGLTYEATDAGSIGSAHTGSVQNLRAEVGAGAAHTAGKAHLYAEAALTGDMVRHNPTSDLGGVRTHGANPGRLGLRATVGGIYEFSDTWSGTASYGIEAESRSTAHTLNIGVSKSF